jgi:RNA polymerase sigma factor (sigma-70 family)
MSDDELLALARRGDRSAFALLYIRHERSAWRFALSLVHDETDAFDVVAEVFAATLTAIEHGKGPQHTFRAYLFSAVRRECHRQRTRRGIVAEPTVDAAVDDRTEHLAEAVVLRAAFASLPEHMQVVLTMTVIDDLTTAEAAECLDLSTNTLAVRAMRARRALASAYLAEEADERDTTGHSAPMRVRPEMRSGRWREHADVHPVPPELPELPGGARHG